MFFKHRSTITPPTALYAMMLLSAMAPIIRAHGGGQHSTNSQQSRPIKKKADNFRLPVGELNLADRPMLPPHGGQITTTKLHYIEVVYSPKETRFYLYSQSQRLISMRGIRGEIVMQVNGNSQVFRYPITSVVKPIWTSDKGYLSTAVDLSRVRDGDMQVTIDLKNIPSARNLASDFRRLLLWLNHDFRYRSRACCRPIVLLFHSNEFALSPRRFWESTARRSKYLSTGSRFTFVAKAVFNRFTTSLGLIFKNQPSPVRKIARHRGGLTCSSLTPKRKTVRQYKLKKFAP